MIKFATRFDRLVHLPDQQRVERFPTINAAKARLKQLEKQGYLGAHAGYSTPWDLTTANTVVDLPDPREESNV